MTDCLHCGEEIDTGHYKDDDEKEHDLDTFDKGEPHVTTSLRRGFREQGALGRLHIECFEDLFDVTLDLPEWAED